MNLNLTVTLEGHILTATIAKDGVISQSMSRPYPNQAVDKLYARLLSFFFAMLDLYAAEQQD